MKKSLIILRGLLLLAGIVLALSAFSAGGTEVHAAKKKAESWTYYNAKVTGVENALNVREEPSGTKITDETGAVIQLRPDEEVVVIGEKEGSDGALWYEVKFMRNKVEYKGYAYAEYLKVDKDNPITPTPTPEPEDEPEDEPDVKDKDGDKDDPDEEPESTKPPVATKGPANPTSKVDKSDADDQGNGEKSSGNDKSSLWFWFFLVLAIAAVFFGVFIILGLVKQNKRRNRIRNARKVDRMRNSDQENVQGKRRPEIRRAEEDPYVREVRQSVYYTNPEDEDEMYGIMPRETEDKRSLRAAVDRLQEHDIINHKIYGEGEVYDNSDVKLMEVRFGNDVRFLNKDSIVAKRLIEIIDDEDQALARRRNRRNRNKRNDY